MKPTQGKASPFAFRLLIGLAIFIVVIVVATSSPPTPSVNNSQPKTQTVSTRQILLNASFEKGFIVIKNNNHFDWVNTRIVVANGPTNQYSLTVGEIKAGETKNYRLSEFSSSDGEFYNNRKYTPKQVLVYADNASGGMQY
ncbi:hypothetical protein [Anaerospora hongkongensis]|uniref:hypothetical protein n=1 Tax=Anaerospora hongkongensis TaxID=244830 RepID=UPI002FDADAB2